MASSSLVKLVHRRRFDTHGKTGSVDETANHGFFSLAEDLGEKHHKLDGLAPPLPSETAIPSG